MLHCESCNHGYAETHTSCPWCGAGAHVAHKSDLVSLFDVELYVDYFLCKFSTGEEYQMFPGYPLDVAGLTKTLSQYTLVSFNGIGYDTVMIALALSGYDNAQLKQASDAIIISGLKWWEIYRECNIEPLNWIDHIDLMEVVPGHGSLKAFGGKMHTYRMQDLPYDPNINIGWAERAQLRKYCGNDLQVTEELYCKFDAQIALRVAMSAEYGVDLRSKSDAQIAETVMKKLLSFKVPIPPVQPGSIFYYRPPEWLKFQKWDILETVLKCPFSIAESGSVVMPDALANKIFHGYKMGIGGLHSTENNVSYVSDDNFVLRDHDVASYYPSLILRTGIYPAQIGEIFTEIYTGWYDTRIKAKHAGDKKTANSLKTLLNGTFGKLGSRYSIFYAPSELIQVTITGQLALLMLIEMLEICGIPVVSANTDGIVLKCPRRLEWVADDVLKWWETATGFATEETRYRALYSRDVNSYIAFGEDGLPKTKGAFAAPEPGASGWPNPTGQIYVDAVIAYLADGVPIADTIRACSDIRQFIHVRNVRGGGVVNNRPAIPKKTSLTRMAEMVREYWAAPAMGEIRQQYSDLYAWSNANNEYLGKVVRWYYGKNAHGRIQYKVSNNAVAGATGVVPCMDLPEKLPDDIDYDRYITIANDLLIQLGVQQ
jgi:hypothetical protein